MMKIHRASVLLTGKRAISSHCAENKEIFECIAERNNLELADFQLLSDLELQKKVYTEQYNPDNFEKDNGYNINNLSNSQVMYTDPKREKSIKVYYQTRKSTENPKLSDKRKQHAEETFFKKLQSSMIVEKKFYGEASCSSDLNQNIAESFESYMQVVLANMKEYLLEEPLSSELQESLKHIFCYTEDTLSVRKSGYKTLLTTMSFEILGKSPLQPVARQNGIQLLQEFQEYPLICEEIIDDLTKVLIRLSALTYDNISDGLKLVDETVFLLHTLKKLLDIFSEMIRDLSSGLVCDNSKYINYKKSCNNLLWKSFQQKKVKKWKTRIEKLSKSNFAQVLFMVGKCVELLNIHCE